LGLDELVDFWGAGLEDDGPEVGDGGGDFGALGVGGFGEGVLLLDFGGRLLVGLLWWRLCWEEPDILI
jgi:hypothetical protein